MKLGLYIQTVVVVCFCAGGNIASIETARNLKIPKFATRNPSGGKLGLDVCNGIMNKNIFGAEKHWQPKWAVKEGVILDWTWTIVQFQCLNAIAHTA